MKGTTFSQASLPMTAKLIVTAGLMKPPLIGPDAYTPTATAMAHPVVITIQPEFCPLFLLKTTLATTPSPKMMSNMVPMISAINGLFMNYVLRISWGAWGVVRNDLDRLRETVM